VTEDAFEFGGEESGTPAAGGGDDRFQAGPWHVRFAGRRTGPHDVERLRTLARRGAVTRLHQVSVDGTAWRSAAEIRAVFAADGTVIAGGAAPAADLQADDDRLDFPGAPADDAMPLAPVVRRFTAGIASVRPVVVAALVLATIVLALPTSRDESGALAWWWSEGPFSIAARAMAVLAVVGGWSVAFLAPEPARAASVAAVTAIVSAISALPLCLHAPVGTVAAVLVPAAAILVALDAGRSRGARPMGIALAVLGALALLACAAFAVLWPSGWTIAAAVLAVGAGGTALAAGTVAARGNSPLSARIFWLGVASSSCAMAALFACAFGGLAGPLPMQGAQAAVSACLVLAFAALAWAAVHETIDTAHMLSDGTAAPDTLEAKQP
jgi:hypothetical protein